MTTFEKEVKDFAEKQLNYKENIPSLIKRQLDPRFRILDITLQEVLCYQNVITVKELHKFVIEHFREYYWTKEFLRTNYNDEDVNFDDKKDTLFLRYSNQIKPGYVYELLNKNVGKFIGLEHIKKTTGEYNVMNCQIISVDDKMLTLKEKKITKRIYLSSIKLITVGGYKYTT